MTAAVACTSPHRHDERCRRVIEGRIAKPGTTTGARRRRGAGALVCIAVVLAAAAAYAGPEELRCCCCSLDLCRSSCCFCGEMPRGVGDQQAAAAGACCGCSSIHQASRDNGSTHECYRGRRHVLLSPAASGVVDVRGAEHGLAEGGRHGFPEQTWRRGNMTLYSYLAACLAKRHKDKRTDRQANRQTADGRRPTAEDK